MREKTIKVKMTTGRSWQQEDGRTVACDPGEELSLPVEEARRLLDTGQAEPVAVKNPGRESRDRERTTA